MIPVFTKGEIRQMKKTYDVTVPMRDRMACFPTDPPCEIKKHWSIQDGDFVNLSVYCFGSHTGTHIDAPNHFVDSGKTVDQLGPEYFIGRAKVFDLTGRDAIGADDLAGLDIKNGDIIFFKTKNSAYMHEGVFREDFAYLTGEAAKLLAEAGIRTLGFDFLSVEKYGSEDFPAHYALLGAGIVIIEGLNLTGVQSGEYDLISLPMLAAGGNGSPIRVLLQKE